MPPPEDDGLPAGGGAGETELYRRVERLIPKLARTLVQAFVEEIPLYAQLPAEQLEGEILAITDANLRLFFGALRAGRRLTDDDIADLRVSAARRAEERVPLDAVLSAYHVGARVSWDALVSNAEPADHEALLAAVPAVLAYTHQVTAAVTATYLEEQHTIVGEERDARRALAVALLSGEAGADHVAAGHGVTVAPAYVVVAVRLAAHPDEGDGGVGGAVAARRKLRRAHAALEGWAPGQVLALLDPTGGSVLLGTDGDGGLLLMRMGELAERMQQAAGAPVLLAAALAATPAGVPAAADEAQEVLRLATSLQRPAGAYRLADLLLEFQLSRPTAAQQALAHLLDPLDRNPDLLHTLVVYLEHDLDRRGTAGALHVHPNTLDYRLRRIVELTSLDPSTARGLQLLAAALTARQLSGP